MSAGPVFGNGFGAVFALSRELLSDGQRTDGVRGMSDEHADQRRGRDGTGRMSIDRVHRKLVHARRTLRAARPRCPMFLSGWILREAVRNRHRRVRVAAVLQRRFVHRPTAGLPLPVQERL